MAVDGVVIVGEQAFGRACISMALAPFMSEVPVLYSGSSLEDALISVQRREHVTAVVDVDGRSAEDMSSMVSMLTSIGCRVVAMAPDDDAHTSRQLSGVGFDHVVSKRSSGIDDVVQAVFEREAPTRHASAVSVPLTQTQRRVLALFATGSSCSDIGRDLGVSTETVKTHLKRIRAKYLARGVALPTRADLYRVAVMSGAIV